MRPFLSSLVALSLLAPATAFAEVVPVATADELLAAIGAAAPGDEIVLADGSYALTGATCSANGTVDAPIVVRSATPLGAAIALDSLEGFKVSGAHWHFEGLDIQGVCAADPDCEHAFHVVGGAEGFVLRGSRVRDFNAQLKVNAQQDGGGTWLIPHRGLVEGNELRDTSPRETDAPVTKLNIDTGDDWVVRANVIADFHKNGGNGVSYGAFMKSGGSRGLFERNLVVCSDQVQTGGTRIGLSFGGGGTAPQFCAPAFDAGVPCDPEHTDGMLRNNIIASCSDVGVYLNLAANTRLLHNTMVATSGADFRFGSTTGEADGNVLSGVIRGRDGGSFVGGTNVENVAEATFLAAYTAPLSGDLSLLGDVSAWIGAGSPREDVSEDYCVRDRPEGPTTLGALEHSLGDCATIPPPPSGAASSSSSVGSGGGSASSGEGGSTNDAGAGPSGGGPGGAGPTGGEGASSGAQGPGSGSFASGVGGGGDDAEDADGCSCRAAGAARGRAETGRGETGPSTLLAGGVLALAAALRRAARRLV